MEMIQSLVPFISLCKILGGVWTKFSGLTACQFGTNQLDFEHNILRVRHKTFGTATLMTYMPILSQ